MSQVNLLPPELRERQRIRRQTVLVAFAGAALVAVVGLVYFLQVLRLQDVRDNLEGQQAENAQLEQEILGLQQFQELRAELEERRDLLEGILANEISWSGVLRDVSLVIPGQMWLTDMTGAVRIPTAGGEELPESPTALVGSIQFNGVAFDPPTVALWLTRLDEVRGWANAWLASAQRQEVEGVPVVTFSSQVDLTLEATVQRGGGQT